MKMQKAHDSMRIELLFFIYNPLMAWTFRSLVDCECNIVTDTFNNKNIANHSHRKQHS